MFLFFLFLLFFYAIHSHIIPPLSITDDDHVSKWHFSFYLSSHAEMWRHCCIIAQQITLVCIHSFWGQTFVRKLFKFISIQSSHHHYYLSLSVCVSYFLACQFKLNNLSPSFRFYWQRCSGYKLQNFHFWPKQKGPKLYLYHIKKKRSKELQAIMRLNISFTCHFIAQL